MAPLLTLVMVQRPSLPACGYYLAAVAAFLAHEPAATLLGQRGTREARQGAASSWRWLFAWGLLALVSGGAAFITSASAPRVAAAVVLALASVCVALLLLRRERTALGELWVVLTLSYAALPGALATGLPWRLGLLVVSTHALAAAIGILAVRGLIARFKTGRRTGIWGLSLLLCALGAEARLAPSLVLSALPSTIVAVALWSLAPHPRHLKRAGWTLAAATLTMSVAMAFVIRASARF